MAALTNHIHLHLSAKPHRLAVQTVLYCQKHRWQGAECIKVFVLQKGVSISASDETSIDIGVLSFNGYTPATQQALTQYNVHSVTLLPMSAFLPAHSYVEAKFEGHD